MPELKDLLGVVTGTIGLVSAWIAYKVKVREATVRAERRGLILGIDDPTISMKPWRVSSIMWMGISVNLLSLAAVFFFTSLATFDASLLLWIFAPPLISSAFIFLIFRFLRTTHPSRVMKSARINVGVGTAQALQEALAAVRSIGTSVARLDPEALVIDGRIPMSLWKYPSIIRVRVRAISDDKSEIEVCSDSILPSILFDFGINGRNVRRIINFLFDFSSSA